MKRRLFILTAVAACMALATSAFAANAHFVTGPDFTVNADNSVTVSGKIAGLGNEDVTITLVAEGQSTCTNPAGHKPPGLTKFVVSETGDFSVDNGQLVFSLTTGQAQIKKCPKPMDQSVDFTKATVTVEQGGEVVLTATTESL